MYSKVDGNKDNINFSFKFHKFLYHFLKNITMINIQVSTTIHSMYNSCIKFTLIHYVVLKLLAFRVFPI